MGRGGSNDLTNLLALACPSPKLLSQGDDMQREGAALALAIHCICIQQGFSVKSGESNRHSVYNPSLNWNIVPDVWNFEYYKDGYANDFML